MALCGRVPYKVTCLDGNVLPIQITTKLGSAGIKNAFESQVPVPEDSVERVGDPRFVRVLLFYPAHDLGLTGELGLWLLISKLCWVYVSLHGCHASLAYKQLLIY